MKRQSSVKPQEECEAYPLTGRTREESHVTGYEKLVCVHRDLRTELLVGMTSNVQPVTESVCGHVGG